MGREFELKYRADQETLAALRERYGPFEEIQMQTTYFDTFDGKLLSRHWTLRQRMENGTSVCTLKIPLPDGSRGVRFYEHQYIMFQCPYNMQVLLLQAA